METALPDLGRLVELHKAIACMLTGMHEETVTLQTVISQRLVISSQDSQAVEHLQNLDRHAQVMNDLSRLFAHLAKDLETNRVDLDDLKQVCILRSTIDALFGDCGSHGKGNESGDMMFL